MLEKVRKYIERHGLVIPGDLVILGVSGGPDSMALMHMMKQLSGAVDFKVVAAHLNHGLRKEAASEEDFVREYCRERGIPFYSQKVDVRSLAVQEKKSLEEMGRNCRYQYFNDLLLELKASRIATAHHKDDVAETVLLHFLRGSGIKGLRGIMPLKGNLIRPLLCVTKEEIYAYLNDNSIPYCVDVSNYDPAYLRNRIRHELIPYLQQEFNPRIVESLNQLADIAREENRVLEEETCYLWEKVVENAERDLVTMNVPALLKLRSAYQRRLILKALVHLKGEAGWGISDVESVVDLAWKQGSSKSIQLKKGVKVKKVYNKIRFTTQGQEAVFFNYRVVVPGYVEIKETGEAFAFEVAGRKEFKPEVGDTYLDYDKLDKELFLRSRRKGDVFRPARMKGRKKVKDFFIDIKLPQEERDKVPLLASNDEIYAILGFRVSQAAAVGPQTERVLVIRRQCVGSSD
ncbi:MAG: tRNA lysidine(34) synthetase TilS [Syntrophomonadaceae bacterium]|nr:tRNA lysidine(34) synthetase TilS [Syntrophomonadaceae bacterium]